MPLDDVPSTAGEHREYREIQPGRRARFVGWSFCGFLRMRMRLRLLAIRAEETGDRRASDWIDCYATTVV